MYPAHLVGIMPTGSTMQVTHPDGTTVLLGEDAFCIISSGATTPNPATPVWLRIMEDIHTDMAAGQLRPGDELPTPTQLAGMYACTTSTVTWYIAGRAT